MTIHWLDAGYNPELMNVIKEIITSERLKRSVFLSKSFGVAGSIALLKELDSVGILKGRDEDFPECATFEHFNAQGLLDYVTKIYLHELEQEKIAFNVPQKVYEETITLVKKFVKTSFFKRHFYKEIHYRIDQYPILANLTEIIQRLLTEFDLTQKPIQNNQEYKIFVEASKKIKKNFLFGRHYMIQNEINDYFFVKQEEGEKELIKLLKEEKEDGLDISLITRLITKMSKKNYSKSQALSLINKLFKKGIIFNPRPGYVEIVNSTPERWFK